MTNKNYPLKPPLGGRVLTAAAIAGPPGRPHLERPRLGRLLTEGLEYPLLLVTAGAGYGKTRTVYSFLRDHPATTTWVQLSDRDNLGHRFWDNFRYALSLSNPTLARLIEKSNFPASESQIEFFLDIFFHEQSLNKKHILVFDDAHLIHNPEVLRVIEKLIYAFLPNTTVILISRVATDIKTIGLLARNLLVQIDESDLRFSEEELGEYLKLLGLALSPPVLALIHENTEGWALAVNLAGTALQKAEGRETQALSALKQNIFKLIEDDIFTGLSPELGRWLIKFSLIEHLSLELIQRLIFPEALGRELKKVGSFIRHDAFLNTYHIHHLLLDYLRQKQDRLDPAERREIYLLAAQWCAENNYKMDALSYYEKAGAYEPIIALVDTLSMIVPPALAGFILNIFDRAPAGVLDHLAPYHTMRIRLLISAGRLDEVRAVIDEFIKNYSPRPPSPFNNRVLCGAYNALGFARLFHSDSEELEDFPSCFEKANHYYNLSPFTTQIKASMDLGAYACLVKPSQNRLLTDYLDRLSRSAAFISASYGGYMSGLDHLARGEAAYFQADFKKARLFARQALYQARDRGQYDIANRSLFYLLRTAVAEGRYEDIREILGALADQLNQPHYHFRDATYDMATGWYYLTIGQFKLVAGWLKAEFQTSAFNWPLAEFSNHLKARLYYRLKKYVEVLAIAASDRRSKKWLFGHLEMKIMEAGCHYHLDEKDRALAALGEAYELSRPNKLDMPFIEMGKDMRNLSAAALKDNRAAIPRDWLERISRQAAGYSRRISAISAEYQNEHHLNRSMPFTDREMEILTDLYDGLSRSEIAAARGLSINTIKSRLNLLYAKLGVENRVEAIRLALEKKLLP